MVNTVLAKYENVDVVVNCAGLMTRGPFMDVPVMVSWAGHGMGPGLPLAPHLCMCKLATEHIARGTLYS